MTTSKTNLKKLNQKLAKYNLELEADRFSGQLRCFCTNLNYSSTELENMNFINSELRNAKVLTDITYMPYFK